MKSVFEMSADHLVYKETITITKQYRLASVICNYDETARWERNTRNNSLTARIDPIRLGLPGKKTHVSLTLATTRITRRIEFERGYRGFLRKSTATPSPPSQRDQAY